MTEERILPPHIKRREACHPGKDLKIIHVFEKVPDPRGPSCNFKHPLTTILFTAVVAALCGADDWIEIEAVGNALRTWLGQYVDIKEGIPSHYTFERVFSAISAEKMEEVLIEVMGILRVKKGDDIVSFDGKSMRGTSDLKKGVKAIHLLNAWSSENGVCIGHRKVDDKSNEITAMPELMDLPDLKGTIITADALNTQTAIAAKAIEKGADYALPVKGNHAGLKEEIELSFKDAIANDFRGVDADHYETVEKSRGRVEKRSYYVIDGEELPSAKYWAGLKSLGMVIRERTVDNKTTIEVTYYILSFEINARLFAKSARGHWGIENPLHWSLDVIFREDKLRYRDRVGARNLAAVRKIVLGALAKDKTLKCGKAAKRLVAATSEEYREKVLKNIF
jgi:predicted transposase YbfD/YdcC